MELDQVDIEHYRRLVLREQKQRERAKDYYDSNREVILRKAREKSERIRQQDPLSHKISVIKASLKRNEEKLVSGVNKGDRYLMCVNRRLESYRKQLDQLLAQKMQTEA